MKRFAHYTEIPPATETQRVLTIGNFDGVHLGHQAVLRAAKQEADAHDVELAVLTFEPHPAEVLKPEGPKLRLVEPSRKSELLADCGVDLTLFQKFDQTFAEVSAARFAKEVLVDALRAKLIFVGENFRFGHNREAGVSTLTQLGQFHGFEVHGAALIQSGTEGVSSSRIRRALANGDVADARRMLGRPHEVRGTVKEDRAVGTKMGFPTINLQQIDVVIPGPGIYAATCVLDGERHPAAAYIGNRPTMRAGFSVEAHLLDFNGNLYNQRVTLEFVERIRDDMTFENQAALTRQIDADIREIRDILGVSRG